MNGDTNTGGGGGGAQASNLNPGDGGSGFIVIKIPSARSATFSGGVTSSTSTSGDFKIIQVTATSSGSETVTFS